MRPMTKPTVFGLTKLVFRLSALYALAITRVRRMLQTTSGRWATLVLGPVQSKFSMIMALISGAAHRLTRRRWRPLHRIWNVVFMQFNRQADGSWSHCRNHPVIPVWGSSVFPRSCKACIPTTKSTSSGPDPSVAAQIVGVTDLENKSLRVIADHIRSCSFLIADGVMPVE